MTVRVHEIAREMGINSKDVLAKLAEMGEFVKSASSEVEPQIAQRLRESDWARRMPVKASAVRERPGRPRSSVSKPGLYKGPPLRELDRAYLELIIVPRRQQRTQPPKGRYFIDEVAEAQRFSATWGECILTMTPEEIVAWKRASFFPPISPATAIALHQLGIKPHEIGWHYDDKDNGTLAERLGFGKLTIDEVVTEIEWRREHAD